MTVREGNDRRSRLRLVSLLVGAAVAWGAAAPAVAASISRGTTAGPAAPAAAGDVGYRDFSWSGATAPTGQKPESKLWFNDDGWWGVLYTSSGKRWQIYRFDWAANAWSNTGTIVDSRTKSAADVLWDGSSSKLYIASHLIEGAKSSDSTAKLLRYSYDAAGRTYTLDAGYPVTLTTGAIEALVIDQDTLGRIWATWTVSNGAGGRQVMVTHSTVDTRTFTAPFVLPAIGAANLDRDDISTLVAYNGKIGVMWSNQNEDSVYFASHLDGDPDGTWDQNPALQGPSYADDHLNIKSLQADSAGQLYAAVKTSLNDINPPTSHEPLILLLILDGQGSWQRRTFSRVVDDQTRPIVLVSRELRQVFVFAAGPCCSGGTIYWKQTSIDNPNFAAGPGDPFMRLASDPTINNPTSTKQMLTRASGLLVLAGDGNTKYYVHNRLDFSPPDTTPPETTITDGPSGTVPSTTATFSFTSSEAGSTFACSLDGAPATACVSPVTYTGLANGGHTFTVAATDPAGNTDPSPAAASWTVDTNVPDTTPPTVTLTAPPAGASVKGSVPLAATAADNVAVARVEFRAGGALVASDDAAPYGATWDASSSPDGPVMISATAVDTSGLTAADSHVVTVDTTAPDTTITGGPSGTVASTTATFSFASSEAGSTFACSLDGAGATACSSPTTYTSLANGGHTFSVAATDAAGNTDPTPAPWSWTVDAPPSAGIVRGSVSTTVNATATSSVTIATPSGTAAGDVLVACLALNGGSVSTSGVPAGWSTIASVATIPNPRVYGYYRVAGAAEPGSYTWTLGSAVANGAGIARYGGVSQASPLDTAAASATGASATSGSIPGVSTVSANAMLVGCMAINSSSSSVIIGSPAGMAEGWDIGGKRHELADGLQLAAGSSGVKTWTFSSAREWAGWLVALRPA